MNGLRVVAHDTARMPGMQYPTKRFGEVIGGIDDARDVVHDDFTGFLPILNGKVLNIDVTVRRK